MNLVLFFIFVWIQQLYAITCKNEEGVDVNSWTIFKLPASTSYFYYERNASLAYSPYSLNDTQHGALTHTMQQAWKDSTQYILYNDENPFQINYNFSVGHAKGALLWDSEGGIFLQHSIPKFPYGPAITSTYVGIPSNAYTYGQHITCFPMTLGDIKLFSYSLPLIIPNIYDTKCNGSLCLGILKNVIQGQYNTSAICETYTLHNMYMLFQKTTQWNNDLWATCVGPYYRNNLRVESWIHGNNIGPICNPYDTLDVMSINMNGVQYSEYNDHSKWAIGESPLVCFGDINRMTTQYVRGGGTFCWFDSVLWNILSSSITSTNHC